MKNILIAIDSFKGSLSSIDAANAIMEGLLKSNKELNVIKAAIADGGEGTVQAIVQSVGGEFVTVQVMDPLNRKINATYGIIENGNTAVIEMASASGITLLKNDDLNPLCTTTFGTGELIKDAISRGVKKIIIGIGGSATNDGGSGMAYALGYKFLDSKYNLIEPVGGNLNEVQKIDSSNVVENINDVEVIVLCDVTNILCGTNGASHIFGPQKGASKDMVYKLDENLQHFAKIIEEQFNRSYSNIPGSGAAGGLGFGLMVFLNAELTNGIDFLTDYLGLEEKIKSCDIVITGEGKMDSQSYNNKAPWGIMQLAKKNNKRVIGIAGLIETESRPDILKLFDELYSLSELASSLDDSIKNAATYLRKIGSMIGRDIE